MSTEVEVLGQRYRVERMTPRVQLHVLRRLGAPLAEYLMADLDQKLSVQSMVVPVMRAIGELSNEDTNYVLDNCLGVVRRRDPKSEQWGPVGTADRPMYDDITLPVILALVREVMQAQFSSFSIAVDPPESSVAAQANGQASPTARTS